LNCLIGKYLTVMFCPRCKQGEIAKATIRKTGSLIFVCQECEAAWFFASEISEAEFTDFGNHMEGIGLEPRWTELDVTTI